jgi:hypothetical protein
LGSNSKLFWNRKLLIAKDKRIGLKTDGTVVAVGSNYDFFLKENVGQRNVKI